MFCISVNVIEAFKDFIGLHTCWIEYV